MIPSLIENHRMVGKMIRSFQGNEPKIHPEAYVDPSAVVIGNVKIGKESTIWPSTVLRGDLNQIRIGTRTSVQDNVSIHPNPEKPVIIGDDCVVGHNAVVHTTETEDYVLIGMGSVINGCQIEHDCIIAAGAVLHQTHVKSESLIMGVPGKKRRDLKKKDKEMIQQLVEEYLHLGKRHKNPNK